MGVFSAKAGIFSIPTLLYVDLVGGAAEADDVGAGGKDAGGDAAAMAEHAVDGIYFRHDSVRKVLE